MQRRPPTVPDRAADYVEHLRVRYSDSDAQGVVHHSNFFRWLEESRIGLLRAIDCSYAALNDRGVFIPLTSCACWYPRPARPSDVVEVHLWVVAVSRASAAFVYAIRRGDETLAIAATEHAMVGPDGRVLRLDRNDPFWLALSRLASPHQAA